MPSDKQDRLTDTLNYIDQIPNISAAHCAQIRTAKSKDLGASDQISLGFRGFFKNPAETERRRALRALLLCLNWAGAVNEIGAAKQAYQNSAEADIRDASSSFFPLTTGTTNTVINAGASYKPAMGGDLRQIYKYRRSAVTAGNPSMGGNCYASVAIWMYLGGAVSLRWLKQYGQQPQLEVPKYFNWGADRIKTPVEAGNIPAGRICRIEKIGPGGGGLHYVLTTAQGVCVGVNNSVDICKNWVRGFGAAPATTYSKFQIAGYLATIQSNDRYRASEIRTAPCLPTLLYTF